MCVWLAKQFEEAPNADSTKHRDRQVVVPSEEVGNFAGRGDKSRPDAHDAEGHGAGDGCHVIRNADSLGQCPRQRQSAREHEVLVTGHGSYSWDQPPVPEVGGGHADEKGGERSGQRFAAAQSRGISSPKTAECAGGRVAPAEEQDADDTNVLGEEVEGDPGAQEIEDDAVPARVLALPHEGAEHFDVEPVERGISMPQPVDGGDGYKTGHQVWGHGAGLGS